MYTNNDELTLLRKALKELHWELDGIKRYVDKSYNRRTYHGLLEDINMIRIYQKDAASILSSVNKDNLINHKNKEILLEQYSKQLDEIYPT